jgi:hypothetical protein
MIVVGRWEERRTIRGREVQGSLMIKKLGEKPPMGENATELQRRKLNREKRSG